MTSSTGKQIITINILPNISKSKCSQTMKLDQLIEYNAINFYIGKTNLRSFSKKSKMSIYLDQQGEILYNLLLFYVQAENYQNIPKLRC